VCDHANFVAFAISAYVEKTQYLFFNAVITPLRLDLWSFELRPTLKRHFLTQRTQLCGTVCDDAKHFKGVESDLFENAQLPLCRCPCAWASLFIPIGEKLDPPEVW
jgi:hypothetical protein